MSLRAFDAYGRMIEADLAAGLSLERTIQRLLEQPAVTCLHPHYANQGGYAARIERA